MEIVEYFVNNSPFRHAVVHEISYFSTFVLFTFFNSSQKSISIVIEWKMSSETEFFFYFELYIASKRHYIVQHIRKSVGRRQFQCESWQCMWRCDCWISNTSLRTPCTYLYFSFRLLFAAIFTEKFMMIIFDSFIKYAHINVTLYIRNYVRRAHAKTYQIYMSIYFTRSGVLKTKSKASTAALRTWCWELISSRITRFLIVLEMPKKIMFDFQCKVQRNKQRTKKKRATKFITISMLPKCEAWFLVSTRSFSMRYAL